MYYSGFATCTIPIWRQPFQRPIGTENLCPQPYKSQLPELTTSLTVEVIYYSPYDPSFSELPWPYREGFRTSTVLTDSWPILTPANTAPTQILAQHFIIRYKDSDFESTSVDPVVGPSSTTVNTSSESISSTLSITSALPTKSEKLTTSQTHSSCTTCPPTTSLIFSAQAFSTENRWAYCWRGTWNGYSRLHHTILSFPS